MTWAVAEPRPEMRVGAVSVGSRRVPSPQSLGENLGWRRLGEAAVIVDKSAILQGNVVMMSPCGCPRPCWAN